MGNAQDPSSQQPEVQRAGACAPGVSGCCQARYRNGAALPFYTGEVWVYLHTGGDSKKKNNKKFKATVGEEDSAEPLFSSSLTSPS